MEKIFIVGVLTLLFYFLISATIAFFNWIKKVTKFRYKMLSGIFNEYYIDTRKLFVYHFGCIPNIDLIENVDAEQAYKLLMTGNFGSIVDTYQVCNYNWEDKSRQFASTTLVLDSELVIFIDGQVVLIYFSFNNYLRLVSLVNQLSEFKKDENQTPENGTRVRVVGFGKEYETLN
jgi:hypothetical protein